MSIVAIIQARMSSTRLPHKVLMKLGEKPVLGNIVDRIYESKMVNKIVVATSTEPTDNEIEVFCKREGIECFRGSLENVLERFFFCAKKYNAETIVRLTGDNALVDPSILDEGLQIFHSVMPDYLWYKKRLPIGMVFEIFRASALEQAYKEATDDECKEHVTPYIRMNPQIFNVVNYIDEQDADHSDLRFTLDSLEDYEFIKKIYESFTNNKFSYQDILDVLDEHPEWKQINAKVQQKTIKYRKECM